jgi:hypothetical protein
MYAIAVRREKKGTEKHNMRTYVCTNCTFTLYSVFFAVFRCGYVEIPQEYSVEIGSWHRQNVPAQKRMILTRKKQMSSFGVSPE